MYFLLREDSIVRLAFHVKAMSKIAERPVLELDQQYFHMFMYLGMQACIMPF